MHVFITGLTRENILYLSLIHGIIRSPQVSMKLIERVFKSWFQGCSKVSLFIIFCLKEKKS